MHKIYTFPHSSLLMLMYTGGPKHLVMASHNYKQVHDNYSANVKYVQLNSGKEYQG